MESITKTRTARKSRKHKIGGAKRNARSEGEKKTGVVIPFVKAALLGSGLSVLLILLYALLLYKQILTADSMAVANVLIKVVSAAFATFIAIRGRSEKRCLFGGMAGGVYMLSAFFIFSLLSSSFNPSFALFCDVGVGVLCGVLFAMALNLARH